jgi:hypothetical protein
MIFKGASIVIQLSADQSLILEAKPCLWMDASRSASSQKRPNNGLTGAGFPARPSIAIAMLSPRNASERRNLGHNGIPAENNGTLEVAQRIPAMPTAALRNSTTAVARKC